jgi:alkaline phosphatase D
VAITRRDFIRGAGATVAAWPAVAGAGQTAEPPTSVFRHGVASGDPLGDRVILWTRVTPRGGRPTQAIPTQWRIATDERLRNVVAGGTAPASADRDFTVKVDARGLEPGRTYYYGFEAAGDRSPVGRTRTIAKDPARVRLAVASCSNYPAGYFNAYRAIANQPDLDAVLHLGDYIYEFANGVYGDGTASGRVPLPATEAITLAEYRLRYATYRSDVDLQAVHARHPFIAIWDDHESANDAWSDGAVSHDDSKGPWPTRKAAAARAFLEWLPVREAAGALRLYRAFPFGGLADLYMLDGRTYRDQQVPVGNYPGLVDEGRSMLGAPQEAWLLDGLRKSKRAGTTWRVLGQQVMFSPFLPLASRTSGVDTWEGYPSARGRIFDSLERNAIDNLVIVAGDIHSSWGFDVPRSPLSGYDARTGAGSLAVEFVTPAISSPARPELIPREAEFRSAAPHLKYLNLDRHGYVLLDLTRERARGEWHFVRTVTEPSADVSLAYALECARGANHLGPA